MSTKSCQLMVLGGRIRESQTEAHFEIMLQGVRNIGHYISEIRQDIRPVHS